MSILSSAKELIGDAIDDFLSIGDKSFGLSRAIDKGSSIVAAKFLRKGADPNGTFGNGRPFLVEAAFLGDVPILQLLLRSGAEIDARDRRGTTALIAACMVQSGPIVQILLEKGANIDIEDEGGARAVDVACWRGDTYIVRFLTEKGAELGPSHELLLAAACNDTAKLKTCLEDGALPDDFVSSGVTPLHAAVGNSCIEATQLLLEVGANVNSETYWNETPLIIAASRGDLRVGEILLKAGADGTIADSESRTAQDHAQNNGNKDFVELLVSS